MDAKRLLTSREVASLLQVHPKQVYRLMKRGLPAARVGDEWRFDRAAVLRWADVREPAGEIAAPQPTAARTTAPSLLAANGDVVVDLLLSRLRTEHGPLLGFVLTDHRGGAELLSRSEVLLAGAHQEMFTRNPSPARPLAFLELVQRELGIAAPHGRRVRRLDAIVGKRLASRPPSAGARLALDGALARLGVDPSAAYARAVEHPSHRDVVLAVARGDAEYGLTTHAWARAAGLSFEPLETENYGLSILAEQLGDPRVVRLCELAQSAELRQALRDHGYDAERAGNLKIGRAVHSAER